ncbi:MAG: N-acetyl-gamma-glutamyl-phosphate reductase [Pseudomonadota bacterium]
MTKRTVFIDGEAGTTGLEISRRLAQHPDVQVLSIEDRDRKDSGVRQARMHSADLTILCLPDAAIADAVELAGPARIIDASSVHRVAPGWSYGLPELDPTLREALRNADRIANPGCYPQGLLLLIRPLIDVGWLSEDAAITLHALSGYSGGGRGLIEHYESAGPAITAPRPYALDQGHKHVPEMWRYSTLRRPPLFSPIVGPYYQGMLVQVPLHRDQLDLPAGSPSARAALETLYRDRYTGEALVSVRTPDANDPRENGFLDPQGCNDTDRMELMVFGDEHHLLAVARYDNLGKGAAGAAVQNMNLALGFEESTALRR